MILAFRRAPGDKLMPERELSEALNMSRTSVRDAIRKLVVMGFLEQKQGQETGTKYFKSGLGRYKWGIRCIGKESERFNTMTQGRAGCNLPA
ncbi:MAG: FadR/GntR family transcriptional regulator [Thermodesulfobacteriota bacterium]